MNRFVENRKVATAVLVLCVLISIFGFGGGALSSERADIVKVFGEGTDTSLSINHSMDAYLGRVVERANMLAEQGDKLDADESLVAAVREHADAVTNYSDDDKLKEWYEAYTELKPAVEALYTALEKDNTADELIDAKLAYQDYTGAVNLIQNDQYPALAKSFNEKLERFPANLIAGLAGVKPLDTFG